MFPIKLMDNMPLKTNENSDVESVFTTGPITTGTHGCYGIFINISSTDIQFVTGIHARFTPDYLK
jgi:hypothetical protein